MAQEKTACAARGLVVSRELLTKSTNISCIVDPEILANPPAEEIGTLLIGAD